MSWKALMAEPVTPDLIGIGAVNLDYIIDSRQPVESGGEPSNVLAGFDYGGERAATADEIRTALQALRPLHPVFSPGGSALNTVASIAAANVPVTVGYVGVRGSAPEETFSFPDWFSSLNIDDRFVGEIDDSVGVCISYTDGGQRSMLTTDGANRSIMDHLERHSDELLTYLQQAKVVLVTSFANLTDISPLVSLLQALRDSAPDVQICCDPGALWMVEAAPTGIERLLELSHWLLLNRHEYDRYAKRSGTDAPATGTILVKGADRVDVFAAEGGQIIHRSVPNSEILAPEDVIDDTGAGDAFAAGFLPSLILPSLSQSQGIELGMRLAREKLLWAGLSGMHRYRDIYQQFSHEHFD